MFFSFIMQHDHDKKPQLWLWHFPGHLVDRRAIIQSDSRCIFLAMWSLRWGFSLPATGGIAAEPTSPQYQGPMHLKTYVTPVSIWYPSSGYWCLNASWFDWFLRTLWNCLIHRDKMGKVSLLRHSPLRDLENEDGRHLQALPPTSSNLQWVMCSLF